MKEVCETQAMHLKSPVFSLLTLFSLILSCRQEEKDQGNYRINLQKTVILDSLRHPWSIAFLSEQEVLITEKDGNLIRADLETGQRKVISGFPIDLVDSIRVKDFRDNAGIFEVLTPS